MWHRGGEMLRVSWGPDPMDEVLHLLVWCAGTAAVAAQIPVRAGFGLKGLGCMICKCSNKPQFVFFFPVGQKVGTLLAVT